MLRLVRSRSVLLGCCLVLAACSDDGAAVGLDGGGPAAPTIQRGDGDPNTFDAAFAGADLAITMQGTVFAEGAPDRGEGGAEFDPPPEAPVTSDGRITGTEVFLRNMDGDVIASSATDGEGRFVLQAPADALSFLHVLGVPGYFGSVRIEPRHGQDYEAWEVVLPDERGLAELAAAAGSELIETEGWIAAGVNAVDETAGGEGVRLQGNLDHDPPMNMIPGGVVMGNRLATICDGSGAPDCVEERTKQIFFPNVEPGMTGIEVLDPPGGGTCALRYDPPRWLVAPHALTIVNVDCLP